MQRSQPIENRLYEDAMRRREKAAAKLKLQEQEQRSLSRGILLYEVGD